MKFEFEGKQYRLDFARKHEDVTLHRKDPETGEDKILVEKSKYPFTSVQVILLVPQQPPMIVIRAKVGCIPSDKFSNELGRIFALRALTELLYKSLTKQKAKALVTAIWQTYTNRGQATAPKTPVSAPAAPLALPPATIH